MTTATARGAPADCSLDHFERQVSAHRIKEAIALAKNDDATLRGRNRHTVEQYLRTGLAERLVRYQLYTEDGSAALWLTDRGGPIVIEGHENLRRHGELSVKVLPDWEWEKVRIIETVDAGTIWVECEGTGTIVFPGYPVGRYHNHFLHCFDLVDGLIVRSREFSNPLEQMRSLGIAVPQIERNWIPAREQDRPVLMPTSKPVGAK
jgi:phenazine biosynthesis protein